MIYILLITFLLVLIAVTIHYFTLSLLTNFLRKRRDGVRHWVGFSILCILIAHIIEVSVFATAYRFLEDDQYGRLVGAVRDVPEHELSDYWYFSFVVYTSLGFGDITPTEELRFVTALETLTGLILIAWSASFLYVQMQHFWSIEPEKLETARPAKNRPG